MLGLIRHEHHVGPAWLGAGLYLIASEIEAARADLVARGVAISEVFHAATPGAQFQREGTRGRVRGPAPGDASYSSFATFSDPDGNSWLLQEIKTRLPGRGLSILDVPTLTGLLREAEMHQGKTPEEAADAGAGHVEGAQR